MLTEEWAHECNWQFEPADIVELFRVDRRYAYGVGCRC